MGTAVRRRPLILAGVGGAVLLAAITWYVLVVGHVGNRELVVHFQPGATTAEREAVRADCRGNARVVPEPPGTSQLKATVLNNVRYRIDAAEDRDLALVYKCLAKHPSVRGTDIPGLD